MQYAVMFIIGVVIGAAIVIMISRFKRKEDSERLKESFGALSLEALKKNREEFLALANEVLSKQVQSGEKDLDGKKQLIDQTLNVMKEDLQGVEKLIKDLEKDREQKFGEVSNQLKMTAEKSDELRKITEQLKQALSSSKARGQWGERMAEDILRLAGFLEGINYKKQKTLEKSGSRPDYTFLLPKGLKLNMDVKFPLDNYMHFLEAASETDKSGYKSQFLKDVRGRIKEVTTRDYINPEENTVDYVIVFIPNEQVYSFINEHDKALIDDSLKSKVIFCSPITLYAILAVIRQAIDNFNMEKTAAQIILILGSFRKQWGAFVETFEKMGEKIDDAQKEYEKLTSTRKKQLDKVLNQIDDLKKHKGIPEIPVIDTPSRPEEKE